MTRDHAREYQRRLERARERGFPSVAAQRRSPRLPRSLSELMGLPDSARESRASAGAAVARSRATRLPLEVTGSREGVSVATIRYWFPNAAKPTRHGRTLPTRADRHLRVRPIATRDGVVFVAVRGSRRADDAIAGFGLQWDFVHGRVAASELDRLRGRRIGGVEIESDPAVLERLAAAGQFRVEEIYRELFA